MKSRTRVVLLAMALMSCSSDDGVSSKNELDVRVHREGSMEFENILIKEVTWRFVHYREVDGGIEVQCSYSIVWKSLLDFKRGFRFRLKFMDKYDLQIEEWESEIEVLDASEERKSSSDIEIIVGSIEVANSIEKIEIEIF